MRKTAVFAAIALGLAVAAPGAAMAGDDSLKGRLSVPADQWLSPSEIAAKLGEKATGWSRSSRMSAPTRSR